MLANYSSFNRRQNPSDRELKQIGTLFNFIMDDEQKKYPKFKIFVKNYLENCHINMENYESNFVSWWIYLLAIEAGAFGSSLLSGGYTAAVLDPDASLQELQLAWGLPMTLIGFTTVATYLFGALMLIDKNDKKFEKEFNAIKRDVDLDEALDARRFLEILRNYPESLKNNLTESAVYNSL